MKKCAAGTARRAQDSKPHSALVEPRVYRARVLSDTELRIEAMRLVEPERYYELLRLYGVLLGDAIVDAGDAIERADRNQEPRGYALNEPAFAAAYIAALTEIRVERRCRDARRARCDRYAAALLAESRLHESAA